MTQTITPEKCGCGSDTFRIDEIIKDDRVVWQVRCGTCTSPYSTVEVRA